jgi:hypothetical protein
MVVSYAVPASPGEKRRPAATTVAGYLLVLTAVLLIIAAILPLPSLSKVAEAAREAYAAAGSTKPTPDQAATGVRIGVIVSSVIDVLLAVLFVVIGALVLRGNQVGRILAWVFAGLGALCTACLTATAGLSGQLTTGTVNGVDVNAINNKISAATPSWLSPTRTTLDVIALLALILVIILLAMPASSAYFRKEPAQFAPVNDPAFPMTPYPPQTPPSEAPRWDAPPPDGPSSGGPPPAGPPSA